MVAPLWAEIKTRGTKLRQGGQHGEKQKIRRVFLLTTHESEKNQLSPGCTELSQVSLKSRQNPEPCVSKEKQSLCQA